MSIQRLTELYGPMWHIDPPPNAKPRVIEGRIEITKTEKPANPGQPIPVIRIAPDRNAPQAVLVFNRIITKLEETARNGTTQIIQLNDAEEVGRLSWYPQINGIPQPFTSQFLRRDGFVGTINKESIEGSSETGELVLTRSPLLVTEGQLFELLLKMQNNENGTTPAEGEKRFFVARLIGFTLQSPGPQKEHPLTDQQKLDNILKDLQPLK